MLGSAMVAVTEVADAAAMALEHGEAGARYPVCSENLSWRDFLQRLGKILGKPKPIVTLPKALVKLGAWFVSLASALLCLSILFSSRKGTATRFPFENPFR